MGMRNSVNPRGGGGNVKDRTIVVSGTATGVLTNVAKWLTGASWTKTGLSGVTLATNGDASVAAAIGRGSSLTGTVSGTVSGRRVDFAVTLVGAATVPDAITDLAASGGNGQATLIHSAPATGGSAITDYVYYYRPVGSPVWMQVSDGTSSTPGTTVTGLTNGTEYEFRGFAVNAQGVATVESNKPKATPSAVTPRIAAYWDDFKTSPGTNNGRTVSGSPNALITWNTLREVSPGGSTVNAAQVDATGVGTLGGTNFHDKSHTHRLPTTTSDFAHLKVVNGAQKIEAHISDDGAALSCFRLSMTTPSVQGYSNGTGGIGGENLNFEKYVSGEVISFETVDIAGTKYLKTYWNGRLIGRTSDNTYWTSGMFNLTAAGVALTGRMGLVPDITGPLVDMFSGGNPLTTHNMMVNQHGHVVPVRADGTTVDWRVKVTYTGPAPTEVKYRIFRRSDGAQFATGTLSNLVVDDVAETFSGIATFTPASLTTLYWIQPYIEGAQDINGNAIEAKANSKDVIFGRMVVRTGQSLGQGMDGAGSVVVSQQTNLWAMRVTSATAVSTEHVRSNLNPGANTGIAHYYNTSTWLKQMPLTYVSAGIGGSNIEARGPGSAEAAAIDWALYGSGSNRVAYWHETGGQSDVGELSASAYETGLQNTYNDRWARHGDAPVLINPVAAMLGYSDVSVERIRRIQGFSRPAADARFIKGTFQYDLQHITDGVSVADTLHLSPAAYTEAMRRDAAFIDFLNGETSIDPRGPQIIGLTRVNAETLVWRIKRNGWPTLRTRNTGYSTGKTDTFDCGLRAGTAVGTPSGATSATVLPASIIAATAISVGANDGDENDVTCTYPTNSFPGTAYGSGPYGANPFNRSNVNTVNAVWDTRASMLEGYDGTYTAAVQSYWHSSGNDFFQAS